MKTYSSLRLAIVLAGIFSWSAFAEPAFEFRDGDRVMLLGDTLIEREQLYGYLEARLVSRFPDCNLIIRNLGWSADTPVGQSRVSFDWNKPETEWLRQLEEQARAVNPTVAILGYGMASSFDGPAGLDKFRNDLSRSIELVRKASAAEVRFILLSPIRHERAGSPLDDPSRHNENLALYTEAIRQVAEEGKHRFISLFDLVITDPPRTPEVLTDNGIHLNAQGYWVAAGQMERALGGEPFNWRISILPDGTLDQRSFGGTVSQIEREQARVSFQAQFDQLVNSVPASSPSFAGDSRLQVHGLAPGSYTLLIDGKPAGTHTAREWEQGQLISSGAPFEQAELLRAAILKKNELFFHRWRPQNETYLFGFRRHEQGQNAREIPLFDPLIEEQEGRIAELRQPRPHRFELVPASSVEPSPEPETQVTERLSLSEAVNPVIPQALPEFTVAEGFEVTLYAANPLLAKPIQINFDPRGRLWVASSSVYPQIQPGQIANDKIIVLEDTTGDGKADKSSVFAEGLLIPTGVEPGDGGVYVGQSTELLHFKDTTGDGKADQRRIVLSGFGTEDTHHILHTLRWGHDGQLYFNQSIYIHSHIETPHGVARLNSGGIFHLRPSTLELDVFLRGFCNPWGHHFDQFGQSFVTDGAGFQGISHGVHGAMYFTYAGMRRELKSVSPGNYPKYCGLEIIESKAFPEDWQGNLVTCDFRAHRIVRFALAEQGSSYETRQLPDLLRTTNVTFRPVDVKLGPDDALYIADWSNPIIQHGEVDFRDPRRDQVHGRIWRVSRKDLPSPPKPRLLEASNLELLDQLLSPSGFTRQQARRVLTERGSILEDLRQWTAIQTTEKALLEALWMHQSINQVEPALLSRLLQASEPRIRAAATRVVYFWSDPLDAPIDLLAARVQDEHPRVRLEAVRALSRIPSARSAELILSALDLPLDEKLEYAIWLSINDLALPWVEAVESGAWTIEGRENQLEYALQAVEQVHAARLLSSLLEKRPISPDGSGPWIELIGRAGSPAELSQLLNLIEQNALTNEAKLRALQALQHAARTRKIVPDSNRERIQPLLAVPDSAIQAQAARLAGLWKLSASTETLLELATGRGVSREAQQAAFTSLREIGGARVLAGLREMAGEQFPPLIRREAAQALAALDLKGAMPVLLEVLEGFEDENSALPFWRRLFNIGGASEVLAKTISPGALNPEVAKAAMRAAREGGRTDPQLILALARGGYLEEEAHDLTPEEMENLARAVMEKGDAVRGEFIYRRSELGCVSCHALGGVGGKVGPDMTSMGASAPVDYLIESILYPNRKIKEGYHTILVETDDGFQYSGTLAREDLEQLVIRDASNRELAVPKNRIINRTTGDSLMPSGLIDHLETQDQLDLYRFLAELGKPGPFDASAVNVARYWFLRPITIDSAQFGDATARENFDNSSWHPAHSLVDGRLLKAEFQAAMKAIAWREPSGIYAGARFQTAEERQVRLSLSGAPVAAAWLNGRPAENPSTVEALLEPGVHSFVVRLDGANLPEFIRLETNEGAFLVE